MRFFGNPGWDTELTDREIELLLSGDPTGRDDLAELEAFLAAMTHDVEPPRNPGQMATALAATARSTTARRRTGLSRVAAIAASAAVLLGLSGVAMAADGASPGHPLYRVDRALELVGINDGGIEERIAEFEAMLEKGAEDEAFEFLDEVIDSAQGPEIDRAQRHLEIAGSKSKETATQSQERASDIQDFVQENRGTDVGADGRDFGRGISDIARENEGQGQNATGSEQDTGPPDHASSPGEPAEPADRGEESESPGKSGDAGQPEDPGQPDDPGSNSQNQNQSENGKPDKDARGND